MSKIVDSNIDVPITDLYQEHETHNVFLDNCSECFNEKIQIDSDDMMVGVSYDEDEKVEGDTLSFSPEE